MKFNYQLVFKVNEDERIVFAGLTTLEVEPLIVDCYRYLGDQFHDKLIIENFIYQPLKKNENETQTQK